MANKILNTRIQLKYDTLTNWQSGPFNGTDNTKWLKAGELAIVTLVPNKETAPTSKADQHPLLFKVGTGSHKFDDLPWASALSADVYDWAKQSGIVINTTGNGDFITGITWDADNKRINVTKGSYTVTTSGTGTVITGISKSGTTITATKGNISYNDLTNKPTINNDNQTVKGNGTAFGSNAAIDIVPGSNVTITPDTANNKITISSSYTDTNQKIKAGSVEFGNNDTVEIKAGTNITVTPDKDKKTITITSTDTNTTYAFAEGSTNGAFQVTPSGGSAQFVKVHGLGSAAYTDSKNYATSAQGTKADNAMPKSGGTFTGEVVLSADPTKDLGAATKQYVDSKTAALTGAMHFVGTKPSIPSSGTFNDGDVILVGTKEYVYDSSNGSTITAHWVELGDEGSHALRTITINASGGLTGGGDLSANRTISIADSGVTTAKIADKAVTEAKLADAVTTKLNKQWQPIGNYKTIQSAVNDPAANGKSLTFIDTISQNANGVITATKKNVNLDNYALKSEIPTDFGVTKITSTDTTTSNKDDNISGLKITPATGTGTVNIEIDDTVTFIFDCGGAN